MQCLKLKSYQPVGVLQLQYLIFYKNKVLVVKNNFLLNNMAMSVDDIIFTWSYFWPSKFERAKEVVFKMFSENLLSSTRWEQLYGSYPFKSDMPEG